jgi:hypothetical protein
MLDEFLIESHIRFVESTQDILNRCPSDVLLVATHGDPVGVVIEHFLGRVVYDVRECGLVVFEREKRLVHIESIHCIGEKEAAC